MNTPVHRVIIMAGLSPKALACVLLIQMTSAFLNRLSLNAPSSCVVKNAAKSAAAAEKVALLADRFTTWLWEDKSRADRICAGYNARFNAHVPRVYSGEGFTFPGMADSFYRDRVDQHLRIGLRAVELLRQEKPGRLHSRKLRSFDEVAFQ